MKTEYSKRVLIIYFGVTLSMVGTTIAATSNEWKKFDIDLGNFFDNVVISKTIEITNDSEQPVTFGKIDKDCSCTEAMLEKVALTPHEQSICTINIKPQFVSASQKMSTILWIESTAGRISVSVHGTKLPKFTLGSYTARFSVPCPAGEEKWNCPLISGEMLPADLFLYPNVGGLVARVDSSKRAIIFELSEPLLYSQKSSLFEVHIKSMAWPEGYGIPVNVALSGTNTVHFEPNEISLGFLELNAQFHASDIITSEKMGAKFEVSKIESTSPNFETRLTKLSAGVFRVEISGNATEIAGKPFGSNLKIYSNAETISTLEIKGMVAVSAGPCCGKGSVLPVRALSKAENSR